MGNPQYERLVVTDLKFSGKESCWRNEPANPMPSDPADLQSLPRTMSAMQEWAASGHHIGAQVYVSRGGQPIADFATGLARPAMGDMPAVPMTRDTLMLWLSAGKPFAAVALAQLRDKGLLDFSDPVVK